MMSALLSTFRLPARRRLKTLFQPEALETRELRTLLAGETRVETSTVSDQTDPATSSASDGRSVVVWTTPGTGFGGDISLQRFNAAGAKVGSEIKVAGTSRSEEFADVAMDDRGYFVVVWQDFDLTRGHSDIKFQRFDANGVKRGGAVNVASTARHEIRPSVATDASGNFVVSWEAFDLNTSDSGVMARRFADNGTALAAAFVVANSTQNSELNPDVARSPDGRFVICFESEAPDGDINVLAKRYAANGVLASSHTIAAGVAYQAAPRVSMDNAANSMVVWEEINAGNSNVRAQRISNTGVTSAKINAAGEGSGPRLCPVTVMRRDKKDFECDNQVGRQVNSLPQLRQTPDFRCQLLNALCRH